MSEKPVMPTPEALTKARKKPDVVDVPDRLVIALDGAGGPEEPGFAEAVKALYGVAYPLRFARKKEGRPVFKVGPLEGEWRAAHDHQPSHEVPAREDWRWRVQLTVPSDVTKKELAAIVNTVTTKRGGKLEGNEEAKRIELIKIEGARFARILHVGPYATESESFARIDEMLTAEGLTREPWHIEMYLSDPTRTAPEKLKTALLTKLG